MIIRGMKWATEDCSTPDREGTVDARQTVAHAKDTNLATSDDKQSRINTVNLQIKQVAERQQRLLDAIETGTIELDETTQKRAQKHKAAREALFIELASIRRNTSLPSVEYLKASPVEAFGKVLREKLLATDSPFAKRYLNHLVDEIVVKEKTATVKGSYAALADTLQAIKTGNLNNQVPTFNHDWCARRESNPRPLASETNTLSS